MKDNEIIAVPAVPADAAKALWDEDRKGFKLWALGLAGAHPVKKNARIDGVLEFIESDKSKHKILVQVKGDEDLAPGMITDLADIVDKEGAVIGLIIHLQKPRLAIITDSVHAGVYKSALWRREFLKIQMRTVSELLEGKTFDIPQTCKPTRKKKSKAETKRMI